MDFLGKRPRIMHAYYETNDKVAMWHIAFAEGGKDFANKITRKGHKSLKCGGTNSESM